MILSKTKAFMSWSGGKDAALSLHRVLQDKKYTVDCLLTNVNASVDRISMHGVRRELLKEQSKSIGIDLQTVELPDQPEMSIYEELMKAKISTLREQGYETALFGDIFLEDLRAYRENQLSAAGMQCAFPLWKIPTATLMKEFIQLGFKAIVVCVNSQLLSSDFCGRLIDESFIKDLPSDVDLCGENGEYHSFVFDGPLFKYPIDYKKGAVVQRSYPMPEATDGLCPLSPQKQKYDFYFCDLFL